MKITDNLDLMSLFFSKEVSLFIEEEENQQYQILKIRPLTVKEVLTTDYIMGYRIATLDYKKLQEMIPFKIENQFEGILLILNKLSIYTEFLDYYQALKSFLNKIFSTNYKISSETNELVVQDITITKEIWDYVIYVLKYCCGEKVEAPHIFQTKAEEDWYLAQKRTEDRIKKIREKQNEEADKNAILKVFLSIIYAFPSLTIDYLGNQTMAQIQWLQKYAAESVSYHVNEKVFAAGNMKKGSKLEFFIK